MFRLDSNLQSNAILCLLSGVLLACAFPPLPFVFLVFGAWVPLFFVIQNTVFRSLWLAWKYVYLSLFVFNALTTWWVCNSTIAGGIFAVFANAFLMSLPFIPLFYLLKRTNAIVSFFAIVPLYISFEYLHHSWDFSWPWLTLGNFFCEQNYLIQWYKYVGAFGGSFWILLVNVICFLTFNKNRNISCSVKQYLYPLLSIFIPVLFSLFIYFNYIPNGKPLSVVAVQPNIDPWNEKFDESTEWNQLNTITNLCLKASNDTKPPTIYLLPETALPFGVWINDINQSDAILYLRNNILSHNKNAQIITGANTYEYFENYSTAPFYAKKYTDGNGAFAAYNGLLLLDTGKQAQHYIKSKLVVGTESTPFYKYLRHYVSTALIQLGGTSMTLGTQDEQIPMRTHSGAIASIVCYESIYGEFVTNFMKRGAQAIFISTNDAWWGNTAGYKQHNFLARLRAVECEKYVIRSANTGISSCINARGDEIAGTDYNEKTFLKTTILLNQKMTFYAKHGDFVARACLVASLLILIYILAILLKNARYKKFAY